MACMDVNEWRWKKRSYFLCQVRIGTKNKQKKLKFMFEVRFNICGSPSRCCCVCVLPHSGTVCMKNSNMSAASDDYSAETWHLQFFCVTTQATLSPRIKSTFQNALSFNKWTFFLPHGLRFAAAKFLHILRHQCFPLALRFFSFFSLQSEEERYI